MARIKQRKINFYSLTTRQIEDYNDVRPADIIRDVLDYLKTKTQIDKKFDLHNSKVCYLDLIEEKIENDTIDGVNINYSIFKLYFKSAKHSYRANLIDRSTTVERENPKTISEGECERTHLAIKFLPTDVIVCLEKNGNGVSFQQILNYFKNFTNIYFTEIKSCRPDFLLSFMTYAKDNFIEEVGNLKRTLSAKVFVDKSILGGNALNFSNRTFNAQHDIYLEIKAERQKSISDLALDIYTKMSDSQMKIKKIRIEGKNESNNDVVIDTSFIEKIAHINADLNTHTGEVNSTQMLSELYSIAKTF